MPATVLNKLRLQKFIIDVAIFFIPRTERDREREREAEKETGRQTETYTTETGESRSRGGGGGGAADRLRRRPSSGLQLHTRRSERVEKKWRG